MRYGVIRDAYRTPLELYEFRMAEEKYARISRTLKVVDNINMWSGRVVGFLGLAFAGVICYEVVSRYFFDAPTIWSLLTSQILFGTYFLLGGGYALYLGKHVNVDIIYTKFGIKKRAILDIISSFFFFILILTILWFGGTSAWESFMFREVATDLWQPPIWPLRFMIPLGAFLLLIQGLAKLIRDCFIAVTGKSV